MAHGSKMGIPAGQGQSQPAPAMNVQSDLEQARMRAPMAESVVPLNVELHQRLSRPGSVKASTLTSAMASLERLRRARVTP